MTEDALVERIARTMCASHGIDPDALKLIPQAYFDTANERYLDGCDEPYWKSFKRSAAEFIACWQIVHDKVAT